MNILQALSFYSASYRGHELAVLVLSENEAVGEGFKAYLLFDRSPDFGFLMFELPCNDADLEIGECFGSYGDILKRYETFFRNWLDEDVEDFKRASMLYRVQLAVLTAGSKRGSRLEAQSNLNKIIKGLLEERAKLREGSLLL